MSDWREVVMENVRKSTANTQKDAPGAWVGMILRTHPDIHFAFKKMCEKKDVSMQTYLRRLVVMAIANETGTPLKEMLPKLPATMGYGNSHIKKIRSGQKTFDDGKGMDGMCTHPGCREIHW